MEGERKNVFELIAAEDSSTNQASLETRSEAKPQDSSGSSMDVIEVEPQLEEVEETAAVKLPSPKKAEAKAKPKKRRRRRKKFDDSDSGDRQLDPRAQQLFKKYKSVPSKRGKGASGVEAPSIGPYVRVTGVGDEEQSHYTVVNSTATDGSGNQVIGRAGVLEPHFYDLASCDPDQPWLCCFCRRPAYYGQLSYLYGPYSLSFTNCRDYLMADPHDYFPSEKSYRKAKGGQENSEPVSVWFHWECFLFTNGCYFINKVIGLDDAVKVAVKTKCSQCKQLGATLSCCMKNCSKMYHYLCGRDSAAAFNEDYCTIFCSAHKKKGEQLAGTGES